MNLLTGATFFLLGIAIFVRTLNAGGGLLSIGVLVGALFLALGALKLLLAFRTKELDRNKKQVADDQQPVNQRMSKRL